MTTLFASPATPPNGSAKRWYQEPYVWLVLGGPLAVIAASAVTIYLAVTHADPVLDRSPQAVRVAPAALDKLAPSERTSAELSVMPAGQARNHVVSPTLPKD